MVTLKSPADIPAIVDAFLGFTPSASLVILGVGGAPSARVDISLAGLATSVEALSPAAEHWSKGVVVALYSDEVDLLDVQLAMTQYLPDVPILAAAEVITTYGRVHVVDAEGNLFVATPSEDPEIAAKRVAASRDEIVAEAAEVTRPDLAWTLARESYRAGNGARAWVYLDRFHALSAPTDDSTLLGDLLTAAVDPKSDAARELLG
jgi:hypothetical protein